MKIWIFTVVMVFRIFVFPVSEIEKRYQMAEKCFHDNISSIVYNVNPTIRWHDHGYFSYIAQNPKGDRYCIVNGKNGYKLFLNIKDLELAFKNKTNQKWDKKKFNFNRVSLDMKNKTMTFNYKDNSVSYDLKKKKILKIIKTKSKLPMQSISPNKKWKIQVKNYNIYLENSENGKVSQITKNGEEYFEYGSDISWYELRKIPMGKFKRTLNVTWSDNSKYLIVPLTDWRTTKDMYLYRSTPEQGYRADVFAYKRPRSGDQQLTSIQYFLINVQSKGIKKLDFKPTPQMLYPKHSFAFNDSKIISQIYSRGWKKHCVFETDLVTFKKRLIVSDKEDTFVDFYIKYTKVLKKTNELIYSSENDRWHHLYLYNYKNGQLKNQITRGSFVVRAVQYVDEKNRIIYFTANGKEPSEDPYFVKLYSINFDGTKLKLLTPRKATYQFSFSKDKKHFVAKVSRVDLPTITILVRTKDGKEIKVLERANIRKLLALGWKAPEQFKVLSRDGKTSIFGLITKPFNFNPNKKYKVLDGTYTGPHTIRSPKTFSRSIINYEGDLSLAQLGFIVVNVDGIGTAFRNKEFRNHSYGNLGSGIDDHVATIKQLAKIHKYMDITKVGIYGSSVGGYDSARGLLKFPDFYKVGVAGAGSHDYRIAKAWWPEMYLGYPVDKKVYNDNSNFGLAKELVGKLLLVHGNMDENVNPATTLRLADELIKANRDFDLLILPNEHHGGMWNNKYFFRIRWDYFTKHLLGVDPPKNYIIQ